jgi:hypothetical protein
MYSMREPERSSRQRRPLPRSSPANPERKGTVLGLGVPVAPSFLQLDDEETVAYNARRTPAISLPALRAECLEADEPTAIALTDDDLEIVPAPKSSTPPSTVHRIEPRPMIDDPAPPRSGARVSLAAKAVRTVVAVPRRREERVRVSSAPPQSDRRAHTRPSQQGSLLPKLLFLATLVMVLMVVTTEIAVRRDLPWLDCRPYLLKAWQFVAQKIPWHMLPKLPRL